jgi:hypothetical protein
VSSLLLLKFFLAPFFVALLSFIQRRWGDGIGGRLIGLPLTTGPFIFIIYIQEGPSFAARAAHGVLVGQVALIVFSWIYASSALQMSWARALATGTFACLATGALLTSFEIPLYVLLPLLIASWLIATKFWPSYTTELQTSESPRWELPARLLVTVILIFTLTGMASLLGPRVAGALSTYPVIISVLGAFSQRRHGANSTVATLHGLMQSLPVTISIMTVLAVAL